MQDIQSVMYIHNTHKEETPHSFVIMRYLGFLYDAVGKGILTEWHGEFLEITNLTHFFMYLFVSSLYMFRASQCSSSGDRIVLIHHLVRLVCVSGCWVCRSLLTGIPSSHSYRLIIPDDVLIQFDLLMMSTVMLETRRDMK